MQWGQGSVGRSVARSLEIGWSLAWLRDRGFGLGVCARARAVKVGCVGDRRVG